jgi:mono/diheme cytochrome c family protein
MPLPREVSAYAVGSTLRATGPTSPMTTRAARALALAGVVTFAGCGGTKAHHGNLLSEGRTVFISAGCGGCHTVASVNAHGRIGPDFDTSEQLTRAQIHTEVRFGEDGMPSFYGRISREQETAVIEFVFQTLQRHKPRVQASPLTPHQ